MLLLLAFWRAAGSDPFVVVVADDDDIDVDDEDVSDEMVAPFDDDVRVEEDEESGIPRFVAEAETVPQDDDIIWGPRC